MKWTIVVLVLFLAALSSSAQERSRACKIEISSPRSGDRVGSEGIAEGTATVPKGKYLWVLARRKGLGIWWPQGSGPAEITEGKWRVLVAYGGPRDAGAGFEVTVTVVDESTNAKLLDWVRKAEISGQYAGIRLPESIEGCASRTVVIDKAR
jgi:hypothetical protein